MFWILYNCHLSPTDPPTTAREVVYPSPPEWNMYELDPRLYPENGLASHRGAMLPPVLCWAPFTGSLNTQDSKDPLSRCRNGLPRALAHAVSQSPPRTIVFMRMHTCSLSHAATGWLIGISTPNRLWS